MTNKSDVTVVCSTAELPVRERWHEANYARPSTDVYETPAAYVITVDMPGVPKDAIHVTMDQNTLVVKGTVGGQYGEKSTVLSAELERNGYYRVFNLGDGIDRNSIDARYEEGVLTVKAFEEGRSKTKRNRNQVIRKENEPCHSFDGNQARI